MRASLNGMNQNAVYDFWKVDSKTKKRRPLVLQEVELDY
jgi:hypothetical protein